ncbi:MAG: type II secretion system F family protein, partial [Synergistaceae bacterium]|nr:type II secretion system F family protein [Synergistaceae bacterium]
IIQSEEEAGHLSSGLERAADLLEKRGGFKAKIFKAMLYPTLVLILALLVLIVFIVYIMPGFQQVFIVMNIELPSITKFILSLGDYFTQNAGKIFLSLLLIIILFICISSLKFTRPLIDKLKLKLPFIKNLVFKSAMANSTRTLAALTAAGVPIISALNMAGDTAGNVVIQNAFESMAGQAAKGVPLGEAANAAEVFPTLVTQMMRIGQETGNLEGMMDRVASWYDQELSSEIGVVSSLLEPLMIVIVGIVVGVMVVSLIGPVTSAMSQI